MPASVPISIELIDIYCRRPEIGSRRRLRELSNLGERTFSRVIHTGRGSLDTANRLAGAMGMSVEKLMRGIDPAAPPKRRELKKRYECSVHLDVPLAEMVAFNMQEKKAKLLEKIIGATRSIKPLRVVEGSTYFHLSLTEGDILRLLAAMMDKDLEILGVTKVVIPDSSWLIVILALLNYNNLELTKQLKLKQLHERAQPQTIDDEALSQLLSNHVFELDMKMKTRDCVICKGID